MIAEGRGRLRPTVWVFKKGGVDDVIRVQIWEQVMKRYKVAQLCEQGIAKLKGADRESEKARVQV